MTAFARANVTMFVDANVPMYAAGKPSRYKEKCREVLRRIATGELDAATDAEVFQEILYRYFHIGHMELGRQVFAEFRTVMDRVLAVKAQDVFAAEELSRKYPQVKPRDLLHTAVMMANRIGTVVSADAEYDDIDEVERVDPLEIEGWAGEQL